MKTTKMKEWKALKNWRHVKNMKAFLKSESTQIKCRHVNKLKYIENEAMPGT